MKTAILIIQNWMINMNTDLDIPIPPNALIIATHRHTQVCMGIVLMAFDRGDRVVPMWAMEKISSYQMWDGETFCVCPRSLCDFRWYIG
jgi:hypothetical protein